MTKEKNYIDLAKELRSMLSTYANTMSVVTPYDGGISITPAESNKSGAFFDVEELVDFCRCKRLSCYITSEMNNGNLITVAIIY